MSLSKEDLEIFDQFKFEIQPVGVKFLSKIPDSYDKLGKKLAFCEMLKHAQDGNAFYAGVEDHACEAGTYVLGQSDAPEPFINGEFGTELKIFQEPRSANRIYHDLPRIAGKVVRYVLFSPLNKLDLDPDLVILTANTDQTEILLRATSYKTGKFWTSKSSPVIGCAWLMVYPYLSGELNYIVAGLGHGMKRRKLFPQGNQIIAIPHDQLREILNTLKEMPWIPPGYKPDGMEYIKNVLIKIGVAPPE